MAVVGSSEVILLFYYSFLVLFFFRFFFSTFIVDTFGVFLDEVCFEPCCYVDHDRRTLFLRLKRGSEHLVSVLLVSVSRGDCLILFFPLLLLLLSFLILFFLH